MDTTKMTCPQCRGQMDFDDDGQILHCPFCGHSETVNESSRVKSSRIMWKHKKEIAIEKKKLDNEARTFEKKAELEIAKQKISAFRLWLRFGILIAFVVGCGCLFYRFEHKNEICTNKRAKDYIGENYQVAIAELQSVGFNDFETIVEYDLDKENQNKEKTVSQITINGANTFGKRTKFSKDAHVIISYHELNPERVNDIQIPENSSAYIDLNFRVVAAKFQSVGFRNIELRAVYDIGVFSKNEEGNVQKVIVNENSSYNAGTWVAPDALVKIYYHAKSGKKDTDNQIKTFYEDDIFLECSSKDLIGKELDKVVGILEEEGFLHIEKEPLGDLSKGWLHAEFEVDSITIGKNSKFSRGDIYSKEDSVVIKYHSFKQ